MPDFTSRKTIAIGEAMVEFAPVAQGLYQRGFAGDTFNTAWHMAQVLRGQAPVGFVTRVGQDPLSDRFVAELVADGLDVSAIDRDAGRGMGLYLIELSGAERSFQYWRDTSAARGLAADADFLARACAGAGLIHLSGITLAILPDADRARLFAALADARAQGARVSFDPNIRMRLWPSASRARDAVIQALAQSDIVLPSFDDEASLWGDPDPKATLDRLARAGIREAAVKNGSDAVWLLSDGQVHQIATPPVQDVRDTTGAGDGFNAGYLASRLMGHAAPRAVAAGQRFAGQVIRHPGARLPKSAIPALG